jgi:hypothetical protein
MKSREETEEAQKLRENLKKQRDSMISNRVKLAKERIRNKLGLPSELPEATSSTNEEAAKIDESAATNDSLTKEKEALKRDFERKRHVR